MGIIVSVTSVQRFPLHAAVALQIEAENSRARKRARARNAALKYSLNLHSLWDSYAARDREAAAEARVRRLGGLGAASSGLAVRGGFTAFFQPDVRKGQMQSVSSERVFARAFFVEEEGPPSILDDDAASQVGRRVMRGQVHAMPPMGRAARASLKCLPHTQSHTQSHTGR